MTSTASANNFIEGYTTTVTAAGTTTLTVISNFQQFFTGTSTQTVTLPVTSTLVLGQQFLVTNNSTGLVTVQSSGGNSIQVMAANSNLLVTCILISGTTAASWNSYYYGVNLAVANPPTVQKVTATGTGTYTTPANVAYIKVRMVGGGGGGGGSTGAGSTGVASYFRVGASPDLLVANAGVGAALGGNGGAGGTASLGTGPIGTANSGGSGSPPGTLSSNTPCGGNGGVNIFGGAGGGGAQTSGNPSGTVGVANTGAGGGGGANGGPGGGASGFVDAIITNPSATYAYNVGTGGAGGSGSQTGAAGGTGYIEVTEYYNNAVVQVSTVASIQPTIQKFTSSSGTYTTPTGVQYIKVRMVGGGGGGAGSGTTTTPGSGGAGGTSTFGSSLLTTVGGGGGVGGGGAGGGGVAGTATLSAPAIGTALSGGIGQGSANSSTQAISGSNGASTPFGGAGSGNVSTGGSGQAGNAAQSNTGSGGGGAGIGNVANDATGAGGGASGYIEAIIPNPSATYAYAVGAAGTAGAAGTNGAAGGAGGSGYIEVTEYYNNLAVGSTSSVAAGQFFAGPTSGSAANPGFRALGGADLPGYYYASVYYPQSNSNYWQLTSGSLVDFTASGTIPTPSVFTNPNFGTISKATSSLPGINFVAPRTGVIKLTWTFAVYPGSAAGTTNWVIRMIESTTSTTIGDASGGIANNAATALDCPTTIVGYFSATASTTYNFKLQGAIGASATLYIMATAPPVAGAGFTCAMEYIT